VASCLWDDVGLGRGFFGGFEKPRDGGLAVTDCVAGLWRAVESILKEIRAMTGFRGGSKKTICWGLLAVAAALCVGRAEEGPFGWLCMSALGRAVHVGLRRRAGVYWGSTLRQYSIALVHFFDWKG
jgi:hypothetical protein